MHRSFWIGPAIIATILTLLFLVFSHGRLRAIYKERFRQSKRERLFLGSVGFFVTALVVRGITIAIHNHIGPFHDVSMHGRHIHHMVWGILLLLTVGYCWLAEIGTGAVDSWPIAGRITAMLYGVAAALILDEFALWLNLSDVYWQREGRESYEAMALFGSFLAVGLFGGELLKGLLRELGGVFRGRRRTTAR
jgi:Ca2+/H+ antiporter